MYSNGIRLFYEQIVHLSLLFSGVLSSAYVTAVVDIVVRYISFIIDYWISYRCLLLKRCEISSPIANLNYSISKTMSQIHFLSFKVSLAYKAFQI